MLHNIQKDDHCPGEAFIGNLQDKGEHRWLEVMPDSTERKVI